MKKIYIYLLLSVSFLLFQASCTNNDDELSPTQNSELCDLDITSENLIGEWQLYYFTKQVNNGLQLRYFMEDGYGTTFLPKDADENYIFKEVDPLGQVTRTGTYFVLKDDSVRFRFKSDITDKDTTTAAYIGKLTTKRLVTYDKYKRRLKTQEAVYDVFDVRQFRNTASASDDLEGAKDMGATVIVDKLVGKWQVYSYLSFVNGREDPNLAQLQAENIGVVYHFYKNAAGLLNFKLYNNGGVLADTGDFAIINDIIHLYFVVSENGKDIEYHLAIRTKDWGERTESGTGEKIEAFTDYIKYMSFIEGSKVPVPFEVISDMKRIE